jgi:hypothetical protein
MKTTPWIDPGFCCVLLYCPSMSSSTKYHFIKALENTEFQYPQTFYGAIFGWRQYNVRKTIEKYTTESGV